MSFDHRIEILCDKECDNSFQALTDNPVEAERSAIEQGWQEDFGDHYCPSHNE